MEKTRSDILWAVLTVLGLSVFCIVRNASRIPRELGQRAASTLASEGLSSAQVRMDGRLAILGGAAKDEATSARAESLLAGLWGVRRVENRMTITSLSAGEALQKRIDAVLSDSTIEFETAGDTLTARGRSVVDEIAEALRGTPDATVIVAGHTDSQGAAQANLDLSQRRAAAVVRALVAAGIDAYRLSSEGYGETRPVADNATPEGRERNRRVEVQVVSRPSPFGR